MAEKLGLNDIISGVSGLGAMAGSAYSTYSNVQGPDSWASKLRANELNSSIGNLNSFDDWTNAYLSYRPMTSSMLDNETFGFNKGQGILNIGNSILSGAGTGAKLGGVYGAIGGGLLGLGAGLFGFNAAKNKAENTRQYAKNMLADINRRNNAALLNGLYNIKQGQYDRLNYATYAEGGQLHSHGADWNTGLNYVGNGGSHEENPYDGVPMGIAPDGQPNLVEEGEVIWNNDYVFSKRLKVPKAIRRKYKLGGIKPLTFAEAAMKANKEAEERPNDPITLRGRDALLGVLAEVQENKRMQKEAREQQQEDMLLQQELPMIAANGGHLFWGGSNMMRPGNIGFVTPYYDETPISTPQSVLDFNDPAYRRSIITDYVKGLSNDAYSNLINAIGGKALNYKDNPQGLVDFAYTGTKGDVYNGIWNHFRANRGPSGIDIEPGGKQALAYLATPPISPDAKNLTLNGWNFKFPQFVKDKDYYPKEAILRYAPVVGSTISVLNDIFGGANKPTGERGAAIRAAAKNLRDVSFDPIGGYMAPNPTDLDYLLNALNAGAGATRDALLNTAGGNRGTATAGILAADNQYLNAIGNARLATEKENFERELKRKEFNAELDKFNKTGQLQAAIRNQGKDEVIAKYLALAADADAQEKLLSNATISADFTNLFDNLGRVGEDALNRADTRWLAQNWPGANAPSSYGRQKVVGYQMGMDGQYYPVYGKNGGRLNKRRRK